MKVALSIEDKLKAFEMRLRGSSLQEIADEFGLSRQRIQKIIPTSLRANYGKNCIYPNIRLYLCENQLTRKAFANVVGCSDKTLSNIFIGAHDPKKCLIDKILDVTGMTYEEAFKLGAPDDGEGI